MTTNTPPTWLDQKEAMLLEFNQWLTGYTNSDPRPVDLIQQMLDIQPYIQMANHEEYQLLSQWWAEFKAACNALPTPAQ
jgi:hypothetical protein